jgi:CRP/FNR family transcriptional regulator, cyclic AMP receptor protein
MIHPTSPSRPSFPPPPGDIESMRAFLRSLMPFSALSAEGLEEIAREGREIGAEKGHIFFQEGEPSDAVFVVRSGRVRIQHLHKDGTVRIVCMLAPGDTFCCLPAMDGGRYPAGAVAAERSHVYRLPGGLFRRLMEREPGFATRTVQHFCGRLRMASCESCWKSQDAPARLAGKILCMAMKFGDDIPLTRRELGELAGTTVETAIRTIKDFERAGWVQLGRAHLRVLDRTALAERSDGAGPLGGTHLQIPTPE